MGRFDRAMARGSVRVMTECAGVMAQFDAEKVLAQVSDWVGAEALRGGDASCRCVKFDTGKVLAQVSCRGPRGQAGESQFGERHAVLPRRIAYVQPAHVLLLRTPHLLSFFPPSASLNDGRQTTWAALPGACVQRYITSLPVFAPSGEPNAAPAAATPAAAATAAAAAALPAAVREVRPPAGHMPQQLAAALAPFNDLCALLQATLESEVRGCPKT